MGKAHQGTDPLFVLCYRIEPLTQPLHQRIEGRIGPIVKIFFAQFLPQMFDRIDLWLWAGCSIRRILSGNGLAAGVMPARLIDLHHDEVVGQCPAHMRQKEIHHGGVGHRPDQ
jgi:hypothetical protein